MGRFRGIPTLRNQFVYGLHRSGIFRLIDFFRDQIELMKSSARRGFAQYGEDEFLESFFRGHTGLYLDIGGNHPIRGSNTYQLYKLGWRGVVVEPIRRLCAKQRRFRPRDTQVNAAAGDSTGSFAFYEMIPSVLSTTHQELVRDAVSSHSGILLAEYTVPVTTVADLYREHFAPQHLSLLCIDTEGHDLRVLRGVDWSAVRPEVVICEANDETNTTEIRNYMSSKGYSFIKALGGSLIFAHGQSKG